MADGQRTRKFQNSDRVKDIGDQTHAHLKAHFGMGAGDDASTLLSPVLQGIESEIN